MEDNAEIPVKEAKPLSAYPNKVFTIPNLLTVFRLALLPFLFRALNDVRNGGSYIPAVVIGAVMILSDILDGIFARHFNQTSRIGVVLDPISDKIIISSLAIYFAYYGLIPDWVAVVVVAREAAILLFGLFFVARGYAPKPVLWGRLYALLWGLAFIFLLINLDPLAWALIVVALILGFFSAGNYYVLYLKSMEHKR